MVNRKKRRQTPRPRKSSSSRGRLNNSKLPKIERPKKSTGKLNPKEVFRLGVAQITSCEDVSKNVAAIKNILGDLSTDQIDLLCFPENSLYMRIHSENKVIERFDLREIFWGDLQIDVNRTGTSVLIGSIAYKKGRRTTNATVLLAPNAKPKIVYEKIHLFDVAVEGAPAQRESDIFVSGRTPKIINVGGWQVGLSICYDVRFAELYSFYASKHVDLILVPSAFLVPTGQMHWHTLLKARAIESQAYVAAPAQCGGHRDQKGHERQTYGHSLVVDPWGSVILDMGNESRGARMAQINLERKKIDQARKQIPMSFHRKL